MRIALINQFYPPARAPTGKLLADLADTMCHRGHEVTVLTSAALYGSSADDHVSPEAIHVIRLGSDQAHGTSRFNKAREYGKFLLQLRTQLARLRPAPDAIVSMTTPPFCGRWTQRVPSVRSARHILWCMDLYPEALHSAGWMRDQNLAYRAMAKWAQHERETAGAVVVLGDDMRKRVYESAPLAETYTIPVWTELEASEVDQEAAGRLRSERGWGDDQCIFLYSGNLGRAHDLTDFAHLAAQSDPQKCRFVVCGEGPMLDLWRKQWNTCFEWLDPVGASQLTAHLLSADVHLISQRPEWGGVVVPSKYQSACGLGRPVLFSGPADSSLAGWIKEGRTGWHMPIGDQSAAQIAITECIDPLVRTQRGESARKQADTQFSRDMNCNRLAQIIEAMV